MNILSKPKVFLFICAIIITFLIGAFTPPNLLGHFENKITKNTNWEINSNMPNSKVNQSEGNNDISPGVQISKDSKIPGNITSKVVRTPLANDFPIGWYDTIGAKDTPAKVAVEGINILMPYVGEADNETITTYLDAAEKAGVKVLLELRRSIINNRDNVSVTKFVRTFKNHPAVFGWYLYDEPSVSKLSPQILKSAYDAIKVEDPKKPVAVTIPHLWGIEKYLDAMDIFMWDQYPVTYGSSEFGGANWGNLRYWFKRAASFAKGKDGFWFVMQGYGEKQDGTPQFTERLPTFDEEKYMLYSAVASGANGLFLWAHYRSQQSWIDSVVTPLVHEFHDYIPAIRAGAIVDKTKVDRSEIQAVLYREPTNRRYLLIAINHEKRKLNAKIKLKQLKQESIAQFARVLEENRYVKLSTEDNDTNFRDTFNSYEVHIYDIS